MPTLTESQLHLIQIDLSDESDDGVDNHGLTRGVDGGPEPAVKRHCSRDTGAWACSRCTYQHPPGHAASVCDICGLQRTAAVLPTPVRQGSVPSIGVTTAHQTSVEPPPSAAPLVPRMLEEPARHGLAAASLVPRDPNAPSQQGSVPSIGATTGLTAHQALAKSPVAATPSPSAPETRGMFSRGSWKPPWAKAEPVQAVELQRPTDRVALSESTLHARASPAPLPAPPVRAAPAPCSSPAPPAPLPSSLPWLPEEEGASDPEGEEAMRAMDAEAQAKARPCQAVAPSGAGPIPGASCVLKFKNRDSMWRYTPFNNNPMLTRVEPAISATRSDKVLMPGEVFAVSEEHSDSSGCTFLLLADGRGWAFDRTPHGVMCTREQLNSGCHQWRPASRQEVISISVEQVTEAVRVDRYLPLSILGKQVLFKQDNGHFLVDTKTHLSNESGVAYRIQASNECVSNEVAKHGEVVRGDIITSPSNQEWLKVSLEVKVPAVADGKSSFTPLSPQRERPLELPPLSPQQERILELLLKEGKSIFFTGSAGTGKTRTLLELAHRAQESETGITAMTGIAASAMPRGATLHSWTGIGLGKDSREKVLQVVQKSKAAKNWRNCKLLVVDEASMMSKKLFDLLEYIGRAMRRNEVPFGGLQLALCGDFFQLPPVSRGSSGDDSRYCFESEKWGAAMTACIELTHVYRQRDVMFLQLLNQVRFNELRPEGRKLLESLNRPLQLKEGIKPTRLYSQNKAVDDINMKELDALPGELYQFRAKDTEPRDGRNVAEQLNKLTLFPEVLMLKVGAQVMLLKNLSNSGGQLVNGSRGVVESIGSDNKPMVRWINGMTTSVAVEDSKHELGPVTLTRSQYPLKLCWAMTIHKSQGMSIDYLEVDLASVFEKGQAYVALSRARTLEGLRVIAFDPRRFWTDARAVEFYRAHVTKVEDFMDKHFGTTTETAT